MSRNLPFIPVSLYRFSYLAGEDLHLPAGPRELWHGVFGLRLRELACVVPGIECRACLLLHQCACVGEEQVEASRTIGSRQQQRVGVLRPPTRQERAWVRRMGQARTATPKGVFRYASMAEANSDWERWHVELVTAAVRIDAQD